MARRRRADAGVTLRGGAWRVEETLWGESQRVRLTTGPPSIISDLSRIRSVHAVAFLTTDTRVLIVENRDGTFTFPGGRLEAGESVDDALHREVWEEARATLNRDYRSIAATRIEFINRVPGRVYRVHPSYLLWVVGFVESLSDEPHHDPADGVVGRHVVTIAEARALLPELEARVLDAAITELETPVASGDAGRIRLL